MEVDMTKKNIVSGKLLFYCLLFAVAFSGPVFSQAPATLMQTVTYQSETITLQMTMETLRGSYFEVLVQNDSGGYDTYTPGEVRTYLGYVDEYPGALVAGILLSDDTLQTKIYFDRGATWFTLGDTVTDTRGMADPIFTPPSKPSVTPGHAGTTTYEYGLGVDSDYRAYTQRWSSSVPRSLEMIEFSACQLKAIYMRDALLMPVLERVIIRTSQAHCPYEGTTGTSLLSLLGAEWNNNQADALDYCLKIGLASPAIGGGVAYMPGRYSVNGMSSDGSFDIVWRHEIGHNWACGDYHADSPEGPTLMCGNQYGRYCGPSVETILGRRDNSLSDLTDLGTYTANSFPPYASLDAEEIIRDSGGVTIDIMGNDFDINADTINLSSFDSLSDAGGSITLSPGTGPGGRDELTYTPPAAFKGIDFFYYTIADSTGELATAVVIANIVDWNTVAEAEDAAYSGPIFANSNSGYTGTGYLDYQNASGDWIEWTVDVPGSGEYNLQWRYALYSGDRPLEVRINGQIIEPSLSFPSTGYWTTWRYNTLSGITLQAGTNTIRTTAIGSSGANIDHLKVSESHLHINFQPSGKWIPSGYLPDYGEVYADRGNGNSYGWDIDITADMRDRDAITDQKWDTLAHMQKAGNRTWEMSLPNGTYDLVIGCGDPSNADFINNLDVEGTVITDPDPYDNFDEYNLTVSVTDGRLTITTAAGAVNAKICFVEIEEAGEEDTTPPTPDPMTWQTAPYATGSTSIAMEADPASDPSGVQYYFTCTAGGGRDSDWQASPTYEDTGLSPDTTYTYTVKARDLSPNQNETAPSTAESATTDPTDTTPPAAPTGLAATAGDATVSLDWNDNGEGDLDGYNVYRSTTSGSGYSQINGSLLSSSDYTDNSVSNGTTYYYVVTAVDTSTNESGYSGEASATPQGAPPNAMHVADIAMSTKVAGKNVNGVATVTVVDAGGAPVEGATVFGHWSGLTSDSDSGITVADGTVSLSSDKLKNPSGTFTFTVDNITKAGWTYDFAANVETSDSITVP